MYLLIGRLLTVSFIRSGWCAASAPALKKHILEPLASKDLRISSKMCFFHMLLALSALVRGSHLAPRKLEVISTHSTNAKTLILPTKNKKKAVALLRCF
jgi:hypothetical protein